MNKEDVEKLVGESMEDMGLSENIEERECEDCGRLIEDDSNRSLCISCQLKQLNQI